MGKSFPIAASPISFYQEEIAPEEKWLCGDLFITVTYYADVDTRPTNGRVGL